MYSNVPYPSRLLYSIYTGREAQYNTINNYTQSILPTGMFASELFLSPLFLFFLIHSGNSFEVRDCFLPQSFVSSFEVTIRASLLNNEILR
jgi:predicted PurR-regulated permease PerM